MKTHVMKSKKLNISEEIIEFCCKIMFYFEMYSRKEYIPRRIGLLQPIYPVRNFHLALIWEHVKEVGRNWEAYLINLSCGKFFSTPIWENRSSD